MILIEFDCGQLRLARRHVKKKQLEVAKELGYSPSTLCQIENGKRDVSADEIARLSNYYNINIRNLFPERILNHE